MLRVFTDSRCLEHRSPPGYPERPERLAGVLERLRAGGWDFAEETSRSAPSPKTRAAVEAMHDPGYVARFEAAVQRGDGLIDSADNPLSAGTAAAAWAAVECALAAADWVMAGEHRAALAATRPPGHHAERATAMGFCYFNNVAVAAEHVLRRHRLDRVAIVDFDVHHGNGTQHLFEERADVLYLSLHQFPFYPVTGAAAETGIGAGQGATLNVSLPAGTGDAAYEQAFGVQVIPALESFAPQLLLISAGFDAWRADPLGGMEVTMAGFERWGELLAGVASEVCSGRSLSLLEGGYDLSRLGELVERYLTGLRARHPVRAARTG